jgi:signal transduction histidine kinase/DNA-binding LacI/PurR family transcriptional regulator/CheY-like chemotaxis protein
MNPKRIALIAPWAGTASGAYAAAHELGLSLSFYLGLEKCSWYNDVDPNSQLDGYIFISPRPHLILDAENLYRSGKPVVIVMRDSEIAPTIKVDTGEAIAEMVDHLVALGHKRILCVTGSGNEEGVTRLKGYFAGLKRNNLPIENSLIMDSGDFGSSTVGPQMLKRLSGEIDFTAIISCNRALTMGFIPVLIEKGLRFPEDLAITTLDEPSLGPAWIRDLTFWKLPNHEIGYQAVKNIVSQIERPHLKQQRIEFKCNRVIRFSCGAVSHNTLESEIQHLFEPRNYIRKLIRESIPDIYKQKAETLSDRICDLAKDPARISEELIPAILEAEMLGLSNHNGLNLITRAREFALSANHEPTDKAALIDAYQNVTRSYADWLRQTNIRTQEERKGLTRSHLLSPPSLASGNDPKDLINGLKQHLAVRQTRAFTVRFIHANKPYLYRWESCSDGDEIKRLDESAQESADSIHQFLQYTERVDLAVFELGHNPHYERWLLVELNPEKFSEIREIATQFENSLQSFGVFHETNVKGSELIEKSREAGLARNRADEARKIAEEATRSKDAFLANMSHEIRTPMNGIIGLTEILLESRFNPEQKRRLALIKESASDLLETINTVLDFSKLEAGKMNLESIPFILTDELQTLIGSFSAAAAARGLRFECRIDPNIPKRVMGDPQRLCQVIEKLLTIAIQSTQKGYVSLRLHHRLIDAAYARIEFTIEDSGAGISEEQIHNMSKPLAEAEQRGLEHFGTSSLSLSIAYRLVEKMGGQLTVMSHPNLGTRSSFCIEFLPEEENAEEAQIERPFDHYRIDLYADETAELDCLGEQFSTLGAFVRSTSNRTHFTERLAVRISDKPCADLRVVNCSLNSGSDLFFVDQIARKAEPLCPVWILLPPNYPEDNQSRWKTQDQVVLLKRPVLIPQLEALAARISKTPAVEAIPSPQKHRAPIQRSLNILLAEDNPINVEVVKGILEKRGHRITHAPDGAKAVDHYSQNAFDLILMDINMPILDGISATQQIRKLERIRQVKKTPILAMTAHASIQIREKCAQSGMDGMLAKPIRKDEFIQTIEKLSFEFNPAISTPAQELRGTHTLINRAVVEDFFDLANCPPDTLAGIQRTIKDTLMDGIAKMNAALIVNNASEIRKCVHHQKGTFGYLGAETAEKLAIKIQTDLDENRTDSMQADTRRLLELMKNIHEQLSDIFQPKSPS